MRIGEVAEASGVPAKTLRYWEQVGVLAEPARTPAGYRDYDPAVLDRIRFVRGGQAVGLTLGELREIVAFRDRGETPCAHVLDLLERRRAAVEQRIAELETLGHQLEQLVEAAAELRPEDCPTTEVCHILTGAG